MPHHGIRGALALLALTTVAACSSGDAPKAPASTEAAPTAATSDVKLTGKVIEVGMVTDANGNYFTPREIEAHRGDIVRFILRSGVHNVHFVADSNPGKTGLPKVSDFLQLPGQEFDVVVSMAPGKYYFQCDPHALLGMVGELEVEDEDDR
jgi:plastocyanin